MNWKWLGQSTAGVVPYLGSSRSRCSCGGFQQWSAVAFSISCLQQCWGEVSRELWEPRVWWLLARSWAAEAVLKISISPLITTQGFELLCKCSRSSYMSTSASLCGSIPCFCPLILWGRAQAGSVSWYKNSFSFSHLHHTICGWTIGGQVELHTQNITYVT